MSPINVAYCLYQAIDHPLLSPIHVFINAFRSHLGDVIRGAKGKRSDKMSEICKRALTEMTWTPPLMPICQEMNGNRAMTTCYGSLILVLLEYSLGLTCFSLRRLRVER